MSAPIRYSTDDAGNLSSWRGTIESAEAAASGQIVTISGYLVDISGPDGFVWNTSMTRSDKGNGACEIVYVEALDVS